MSGSEDREKNEDEDFTIIVEGKSLTCQKHLLKEKSEYFRAMIDSCMVESKTNKVTLQDQQYNIVSALVDFIKTGELKVDRGGRNMRKVTQAAVMLQIDGAIQNCTAYWKQTLDHEKCLQLMIYAKSLNLETLYSCAKRHALFNFSSVKETTDFLQLDVTELAEYLSCPHLNCSNEIEILDAILSWYKQDKQRRKPLLEKLLTCFHGEEVKEENWFMVENHELVKESEVWCKYVQDKRQTANKPKDDKFRKLPVIMLSVGGYVMQEDSAKPCTDVCRFDMEEGTFKPFLSLKDIFSEFGNKMGYQVTVVGKDMYISGGQLTMAHYSMIMDVWKLDGFELKWEKVTKLTSPRRHHGACGSTTSLFIMGGFGKYRDILDTVQEFNTVDGKWSDLPKMPHTWFTPQAVYHENKLYVYKTFLICLDMETLEWTTIRRTPCSFDDMNTFTPYYFENYIYEFPYLDQELDWFYEFELGKLQFRRTSPATGEWEAVSYTDAIQFGNRTVVCNSKFYTINRHGNEFVCVSMYDFSKCKKLGTSGKAGLDCFIVALPHYPVYKINS